MLHVAAAGLKNTKRCLMCKPPRSFASRSGHLNAVVTLKIISTSLQSAHSCTWTVALFRPRPSQDQLFPSGPALEGGATSALRCGVTEEEFPAEPHRVGRGVNGEADGTRVVEDLVVVSPLPRRDKAKAQSSVLISGFQKLLLSFC